MENQATVLQFDWDEVDGAKVTAVLATGSGVMSDGSLFCEQIALVVGAKAVVMRVGDDTDEVIVSLEEAAALSGASWETLDQLAEISSQRLGWCC